MLSQSTWSSVLRLVCLSSIICMACAPESTPLPDSASGTALPQAVIVPPDLPSLPPSERPALVLVPDPDLPARSTVFPELGPPVLMQEYDGQPVVAEQLLYADGRPEKIAYTTRAAGGRLLDHGPDLRWYANGVLALRRTWQMGSLQGRAEAWHVGGLMESSGEYQADLRQGIWKTWYETGAPKSVQHYAQGVLDGLSQEWYPDGGRKSRTLWLSGKEHGAYQVWYRDGGLAKDGTMLGGRADGPWREWTESGAPKVLGTWLDGVEHGSWLRLQEDGLVVLELYDRGLLVGPRRIINAEGVSVLEETWVAGRLHGLAVERFSNGLTKSSITWVEGVREGPAEWFHPDGSLWTRGQHVAGKREGRFVFKNLDGTDDLAWSGLYADDARVGP